MFAKNPFEQLKNKWKKNKKEIIMSKKTSEKSAHWKDSKRGVCRQWLLIGVRKLDDRRTKYVLGAVQIACSRVAAICDRKSEFVRETLRRGARVNCKYN